MPPVVLVALAAAGGYVAWAALKREMARVEAELERARKAESRPDETLERDPETGRYRLKRQAE